MSTSTIGSSAYGRTAIGGEPVVGEIIAIRPPEPGTFGDTVTLRVPDERYDGGYRYHVCYGVDPVVTYEQYRVEQRALALVATWPSCDRCNSGPSRPCARTCAALPLRVARG
jgi:hypothetical protein